MEKPNNPAPFKFELSVHQRRLVEGHGAAELPDVGLSSGLPSLLREQRFRVVATKGVEVMRVPNFEWERPVGAIPHGASPRGFLFGDWVRLRDDDAHNLVLLDQGAAARVHRDDERWVYAGATYGPPDLEVVAA